jgi:hypothetical protein
LAALTCRNQPPEVIEERIRKGNIHSRHLSRPMCALKSRTAMRIVYWILRRA